MLDVCYITEGVIAGASDNRLESPYGVGERKCIIKAISKQIYKMYNNQMYPDTTRKKHREFNNSSK